MSSELTKEDDIVLRVKNVSKRFEMYSKPRHRLQQMLFGHWKTYYKEFWALKDINFEVKRGECVGVIGKNGAGKSTLLQILVGTLQPTTGSVEIKGRVAALLELGSGFNPEFTGRENVYLNASILGLTKKEIDAKYQEIVDFADIGEFIDQPVKTYSSGMMVRLAFAVQVMVEPDILIVDEALAVGDIDFQLKCMEHMQLLRQKGTSIFFVTHVPELIQKTCEKGLCLNQGTIFSYGDMNDVICAYERLRTQSGTTHPQQTVSSYLKITQVTINGHAVDRQSSVNIHEEKLQISISYLSTKKIDNVVLGVMIRTVDLKSTIIGINTKLDGMHRDLIPGTGKYEVIFDNFCVMNGDFIVTVGIFEQDAIIPYCFIEDAGFFHIERGYHFSGIVNLPHRWDFTP